MRLFVAIEMPEHIRQYMLELQKQMHNLSQLRFVHDFHLTLKFLGEVREQDFEIINENLSTITFQKIKGRAAEIRAFPNLNNPRVVWVGIEPADKITELQRQVDEALLSLFKKDERFTPHVTLCRVKSSCNKNNLIEKIHSIKTDTTDFEISKFKLIESNLTPIGPVYRELASYHVC